MKQRVVCILLSLTLLLGLVGCAAPGGADKEAGKLAFTFYDNDDGPASGYWGDATLVHLPDGEYMMIDTGYGNGCEADIVERIQNAGVTKIKTAVLSHYHSDHYGGLKTFIKTFGIETLYFNPIQLDASLSWNTDSTDMALYIDSIEGMGVETVPVLAGDSAEISGVQVDFLYPAADTAANTINNTSMVCTLAYNGQKALFAADLYKAGELTCLNEVDNSLLKADLLKIMHHGADTSGTAEFITAVSPQVAVCMGNHIINNLTEMRYKKVGCTTYQTWRDGDVHVLFTGDDLEVSILTGPQE